MVRSVVRVLILFAALSAPQAGFCASGPVGAAVAITNLVQQTSAPAGSAAGRQLSAGDEILYGHRLTAGPGSQGEFELLDQTRLVVHANSSVLLDDLIVGSDNSITRMTLSALAGSFRFISGESDSNAYVITTPVSTLGIRGTAFDVYVGPQGHDAVMLLSGRVRMCPRGSTDEKGCRELTRACEVAVRDRENNTVEILSDRDAGIGGVPLSAAFPFVEDQQQLDRPFRVRGADRCATRTALIVPSDRTRARRTITAPQAAAPPDAPPSASPPADDEPAGVPNNPGNDRNVGNAGESPGGGGGFGGGSRGRSDNNAGGGGNSNSGGGGNRNSGGGNGNSGGGGNSSASNAGGNGNGNGNGKGNGNS